MSAVADVSDEEVKSLAQSIFTRYGIDFTCYEPKSLRRRIIRVMSRFGIGSTIGLWSRFLKDRQFIFLFMNEISVGMTSMFRDPVLWKHLKYRMMKEWAVRDSISIWHAGCSTGEEVFTMGIVMKEANLLHKAKAVATDINRDAIETASAGTYHKIRMIENERNYREYVTFGDLRQYYSSDVKTVTMNSDLIRHVSFQYHNLINDGIPGKYDIIFCRNVMIYFDTIARNRLLEKFHEALNPNGYLITGFYDTMISNGHPRKFKLIDPEAKIFSRN